MWPTQTAGFMSWLCDTGTTTVEITPSANTLNHTAGVPFTVNLQQGQVLNMQGQLTSGTNPYTGVDLTGSKIQSISTGSGNCKRIAVFSGSGRISLTCNDLSSSLDNYIYGEGLAKICIGKEISLQRPREAHPRITYSGYVYPTHRA